jgi:hypothetical protein
VQSQDVWDKQATRQRMREIEQEFLELKEREAREQERRREEHFRRHYERYQVRAEPYEALVSLQREKERARHSFHEALLQDGLNQAELRQREQQQQQSERDRLRRSYVQELRSQM